MQLDEVSLSVFKQSYCNENQLIADLLEQNFSDILWEPILDIGSGLGDISIAAFPNRNVAHLDVLSFDRLLPPRHSEIMGDFFSFPQNGKFGSLLFCHVLQYLDHDVQALHDRISELAPRRIVTVLNTNQDFMGELLKELQVRFPYCNPEIAVPGFEDPSRYTLIERIPFQADIVCSSFRTLAHQICYLFEIDTIPENIDVLTPWLANLLPRPGFSFDQEIRGYKCLTT